jgi:aminopeptidase N/puromycin-sensitive aminopeptidase
MKTATTPVCELIHERTQTLNVPSGPVFFPNAGGKGYYRSQYAPADYQRLVEQVETSLDQEDRIGVLGNQWALTHSGKAPIGDYLQLVSKVRNDSSLPQIQTIAAALQSIDQRLISSDEDAHLLAAWVRATFTTPLQHLGQPGPEDTPKTKELRAALFSLLGDIGSDPEILARSRDMADRYLNDPGSVDLTLAAPALRIAARNGDAQFYERMQHISETAANPQLHIQTLRALALFRDPALVERTLQYAVSGKVRNQDSVRLISTEFSDRSTRDLAWQFVQENWPKVQAQLTTSSGGNLVASTSNFCSEARRKEVMAFFASHPVDSSKHALDIAQSNINDCVEFGEIQRSNLKQWLESTEVSQASAEPRVTSLH